MVWKTKNGTVALLSGILIAILLMSCSREVYDVTLNAVLADSKTGQPIPGAYCNVLCLSQDNIDESLAVTRKVQSDESGRVAMKFDRGYLLEIKASSSGYLNLKKELTSLRRLPDTIFMEREPQRTDLSLSVLSGYDLKDNTPFIRIKKEIAPDAKGKKQQYELLGFDFLNNKVTSNLEDADVWLDPRSTTESLIFKTNDNGGIYPVYENELSQSFFLEIEYVPELKYFKSYKTNGNEKGFFVLCRDGKRIVKMIPEDYLCRVEYNDGDRNIQESGVRLNYIIQKDTVNSNKFPLVLIYELLNIAQTTSMNSVKEENEVAEKSIEQ
jgi:hypothetical protein